MWGVINILLSYHWDSLISVTKSSLVLFTPSKSFTYHSRFRPILTRNQKRYNIFRHLSFNFTIMGLTWKNTINFNIVLFFTGCDSGYIGRLCDIKCRFPNYGLRCQSECKCFEKDCHHIHGCGNLSSGTFSNFVNWATGTFCETEICR